MNLIEEIKAIFDEAFAEMDDQKYDLAQGIFQLDIEDVHALIDNAKTDVLKILQPVLAHLDVFPEIDQEEEGLIYISANYKRKIDSWREELDKLRGVDKK